MLILRPCEINTHLGHMVRWEGHAKSTPVGGHRGFEPVVSHLPHLGENGAAEDPEQLLSDLSLQNVKVISPDPVRVKPYQLVGTT